MSVKTEKRFYKDLRDQPLFGASRNASPPSNRVSFFGLGLKIKRVSIFVFFILKQGQGVRAFAAHPYPVLDLLRQISQKLLGENSYF